MIKRLFDIVFSLFGLSALSPVFLFIIFLIKKEDNGPVFYAGPRVGKDGKNFKMLKFRTMVINADKIGGPSTANDDPRITKIGKFLRKCKLDEIPQLINVLKGDMSFVGPRPEVQSEVETYSEEEKQIFKVRPGITDWASIKFHNEGEILKGSKDPHQAYREKIRPEKLRLQMEYVKRKSLLVDLQILVKTALRLVETRLKTKNNC